MALTNAEKQARYRERHIIKRRDAQRVASMLMRQHVGDKQVIEVAEMLNGFFNREGVQTLRRRLKELSEDGPGSAYDRAQNKKARDDERGVRDWWLREHPGRTRTEYNRLLRDMSSEVWDWRRAKGRAAIKTERRAWERDHPGEQWQEHQCGMSDREYSDYQRWLRQYNKRRLHRAAQAKVATQVRTSRKRAAVKNVEEFRVTTHIRDRRP